MKVCLQVVCKDKHIPSAEQFALWLNKAIALTPKPIAKTQQELTIRVVSEAESQTLNHQYRYKNKPTNVLSFPPSKIPGFELDSLGDLAICAAVVAKEAKQQHLQINAHWAHMLVHGLLHLLGYDHVNEADAANMEQLEAIILKQLGFSNPYATDEMNSI